MAEFAPDGNKRLLNALLHSRIAWRATIRLSKELRHTFGDHRRHALIRLGRDARDVRCEQDIGATGEHIAGMGKGSASNTSGVAPPIV